MEAGKGLVWSMFPNEGSFEVVEAKMRPMMSEVARKLKGKYYVTITDTDKFKEAVENMLGATSFPAIAVQKKAGEKKKYVYNGDMNANSLYRFIPDVDNGLVTPKLKSEPE